MEIMTRRTAAVIVYVSSANMRPFFNHREYSLRMRKGTESAMATMAVIFDSYVREAFGYASHSTLVNALDTA